MVRFGRKQGWPGRVMRKRALAGHKAEEILEFLGDGELRNLKEVADAVDLPEGEVEKILDILTRTGFIRKGVQITDLGSNFLKSPVRKRKLRL